MLFFDKLNLNFKILLIIINLTSLFLVKNYKQVSFTPCSIKWKEFKYIKRIPDFFIECLTPLKHFILFIILYLIFLIHFV